MEQIICLLSTIPIRREPNHRSEQVSQLIFGECASIRQKQNSWFYIETTFDQYNGWIEEGVTEVKGDNWSEEDKIILSELINPVRFNDKILYLPAGAELFKEMRHNMSTSEGKEIIWKNSIKSEQKSIITTALKFLNSPYLWGGRTCFGIDCSGLTQIVCKIHGVALPRDAKDQAKSGFDVLTIKEASANDLLFFGDEAGKISHVGIYMGNNKIIHASKSVRIDAIDEIGIFNADLKRYTHKLLSVRRISY